MSIVTSFPPFGAQELSDDADLAKEGKAQDERPKPNRNRSLYRPKTKEAAVHKEVRIVTILSAQCMLFWVIYAPEFGRETQYKTLNWSKVNIRQELKELKIFKM